MDRLASFRLFRYYRIFKCDIKQVVRLVYSEPIELAVFLLSDGIRKAFFISQKTIKFPF